MPLPPLPERGASPPPATRARLPSVPLFPAVALAVCALGAALGGAGETRAAARSWPDLPPARVTTTRSGAEMDKDKEYRVKAALLFNFLKYATFPDGTFGDADPKKPDPIVVLVVGDDPFGPTLEKALGKKKVGGRRIEIVRRKTPPEKVDAHLVFASKLPKKAVDALIDATHERPCILIGEAKNFAKRGGFINFYTSKGKIRFEVNTRRQEDTGISLAAQVLKLARVVEGDPLPRKKRGGVQR
ncbi:MAG: YfiR family protein [Planctomycetota bacterium]